MSKGLGAKIVIRFSEEIVGDLSGNESAFTLSGKEYQYVNGPLITKLYQVQLIEIHPGHLDHKHLLLTMHPQKRFNNVNEVITISYDANQGSIVGKGGKVESFEVTVTPTDLVSKPTPHEVSNINVSGNANVEFSRIAYKKAYSEEIITVSAAAIVEFINVGEINP